MASEASVDHDRLVQLHVSFIEIDPHTSMIFKMLQTSLIVFVAAYTDLSFRGHLPFNHFLWLPSPLES